MTNETLNITVAIGGLEEHWQLKGSSNLDALICAVGEDDQKELLLELIPIDLEYRWRRANEATVGNPWRLEDYTERFPQIGPINKLPIPVIVDEFRCRWWWGDRPAVDEFIRQKLGSNSEELQQKLSAIQQVVTQSTLCGQTLAETMNCGELIQMLRENSLADDKALQAFEATMPTSASVVVSDLASRNLLTPFQLSQLTERKPDRLILGEYVLQEPIGSGGMGTVYKAIHRRMRRVVAIKVLSEKVLASNEIVQRFHHEIRAIAQLNHPNIVTAFDAGEEAGRHYLVMEFVPGTDLSSLVQDRGAMSPDSAVACIRQAAIGLGYAHSQGIIHRDVKPANLLLGSKNEIKVLDLGLARFDNTHVDPVSGKEATQLTQVGALMGTADYISPEQSRDTRNADARSDIYSLGCSLFFLLTGRAVFSGETLMDVILAHHDQAAPMPSSLVPGVSHQLDLVVQRMVAKKPQDRPQSMDEVVKLLDAVLTGLEIENIPPAAVVATAIATPTGPASQQPPTISAPAELPQAHGRANQQEPLGSQPAQLQFGPQAPTIDLPPPSTIASDQGKRIQKWRQQDKVRKQLILLGSLLVVFVLAAYFIWQNVTETTIVVDWPEDTRSGGRIVINDTAVPLPKKGSIELPNRPGRFTVELTREGFESQSFEFTLLSGEKKTLTADWLPSLSTVQKKEFRDVSGLIKSLAAADLESNDPRLEAARERWLKFFRKTRSASAHRLAMQELAKLRSPADSLNQANHVSNSDLKIAQQRDPKFATQLVAVLGDSRFRHWAQVSDVVFTNRGSVISGAADGQIIEWNLKDGQPIKTIDLKHAVNCLDLADDILAVGTSDGTACTLLDIRDWSKARSVPQFGKEVSQAMAFSPDGKRLAIASHNDIHVWEMSTTASFQLDDHGAHTLRFSRDGKRLVSVGTEHIRVLELASRQLLFEIKKPYCQDAMLINDGTLLTAIREEVSHWDLESKQQTKKPGVAKHFASSPVDEGHLAYVVRNQISLHDQSGDRTANPIQGIVGHSGYIGATYSPDGKYLAVIGETGRFDVWQTANWTQIHASRQSHQEAVTGIGVTPEGRQLVSASHDGTVRIWSLSQASQLAMIPVAGTPGSNESPRITRFDLDHNGEQAALAGSAIPLQLLDLASRTTQTVKAPTPTDIRYGQPDQLVAASPFSLAVVDTANNKTRQPKSRLPMRIAHAEFSPNGKEIAAAQHPSVTPVIQFFSPEFVALRTLPGGLPIKYLPNGQLVCLGGGTTLKILDPTLPATMQPMRSITAEHHPSGRFDTTPKAIAVNPLDKSVAVSYEDGIITLHDAKMWAKKTYRIAPSAGMALDLTYTPDGRHLITANSNGTIFVIRATLAIRKP